MGLWAGSLCQDQLDSSLASLAVVIHVAAGFWWLTWARRPWMFSLMCLAVGAGCWLSLSLMWFLILKGRKRVRAKTARLLEA